MDDAPRTSLNTYPWLSSPAKYIRENALAVLGGLPTMETTQFSETPPLYECRIVGDSERKLVAIGMGCSRDEAERFASIQMCRIIDGLVAEQRDDLERLAERAVKAVPPELNNPTRLENLYLDILKMIKKEPNVLLHRYGTQFITVLSWKFIEGLGLAATVEDSLKFATIDAFLRIEKLCLDHPHSSPTVGVGDTKVSSTPQARPTPDLEDYLSQDIEQLRGQSWYSAPKNRLYAYAIKRWNQRVEYTTSSFNEAGRTQFLCEATVSTNPSIVGRGRATRLQEASRLAAISYITQLGGLKHPHPEVQSLDKVSKTLGSTLPSVSANASTETSLKAANETAIDLALSPPKQDSPSDASLIKSSSDTDDSAIRSKRLYDQICRYSLSFSKTLPTLNYEKSPDGRILCSLIIKGLDFMGRGIDTSRRLSRDQAIRETLAWVERQNADTTSSAETDSTRVVSRIEPVDKTAVEAQPKTSTPSSDLSPKRESTDKPSPTSKKIKLEDNDSKSASAVSSKHGSTESIPATTIRSSSTDKNDKMEKPLQICIAYKTQYTAKERAALIKQFAKQWNISVPHYLVSPSTSDGKLVWKGFCEFVAPEDERLCVRASASSKNAVQSQMEASLFALLKTRHPEMLPLPETIIQIPAVTLQEKARQIQVVTEMPTLSAFDLDHPMVELKVSAKAQTALLPWIKSERNLKRLCQVQRQTRQLTELLISSRLSERSLQPANVSVSVVEENSVRLLKDALARQNSSEGQIAQQQRERLAAYQQSPQFLAALSRNQVVIVAGQAGCGKSTQIPNCILEQMVLKGFGAQCNILVTEPRRIAAIALAHRVAEERGESVGQRIGYQVRFDNRSAQPYGGITFCTTGILMNILCSNPRLYGFSHVIIDEAHERDLLSDLSLIVLKDLLLERPELRLIVMSASMDVSLYADYFAHFATRVVEIESVATRVEALFLEDVIESLDPRLLDKEDTRSFLSSELKYIAGQMSSSRTEEQAKESIVTVPYGLLEAMIGNICQRTEPQESILVFLPGWDEMATLQRCLVNEDLLQIGYADPSRFRIHMIHSQMRSFAQQAMFEMPPPGVRKIILATNIAESSITIEDVVHVVDSAKAKVSFYETEVKLHDLSCHWISRANSAQRRGRAGRSTGHGQYYCLISRHRYVELEPMQRPEILRADLQEACLLIKSLGLTGPIEKVFQRAMDVPEAVRIERAIRELQEMDALTADEVLTPLGQMLVKLPLAPSVAKMVIFGMLCHCLEPIVLVAAIISSGGIFISSKMNEAHEISPIADHRLIYGPKASESDHLAAIEAFSEWKRERDKFASLDEEAAYARSHGLSLAALTRANQSGQQLFDLLEESGLIRAYERTLGRLNRDIAESRKALLDLLNENAQSANVIKTCILIGLYPQLAIGCPQSVTGTSKMHRRLYTVHKEAAMLHQSSVNYNKDNLMQRPEATVVYAFQEKIKGKAVAPYIFGTTTCPPLGLIMFSATSHRSLPLIDDHEAWVRESERLPPPLILDWIRFKGDTPDSLINLIKLCSDQCFVNLISRLALACGSARRGRATSESLLETMGEFTDDELLSYVDKIVKSVVKLIEQSEF